MRIGLVAPPWAAVPPVGYGGTEAVLDALARGLQAAGHEVLLFTTGDSTCPVERHWWHATPPEPMGNTVDELAHVRAAYDALRDCDVIHDHTVAGPAWGRAYGPHRAVHVLTHHGEFTSALRPVLACYAQHSAIVAISQDHARHARAVPVAAVIPHGIDLTTRPVGPGDGGYAMFVGRMDPTKGVDRAVRIARAAGVPLKIAAKMREPHERAYYSSTIAPLLGRDVTYLGEVSPADRDLLLAHAVALLNPIAWAEPFGMVMIEALAVGTPVVALRSGSVAEIVDDGVTGFVCAEEADAVAALRRIAAIDRRACRAAVEQRFSAERMTADHLALYERLLDRKRATRPAVIDLTGPREIDGRRPARTRYG